MGRPPGLSGEQVIAALRRAGFEVVRVRGSHHLVRHPDGRATVVPVDSGEHVGPGLMSKILADCEMTPEEFGKFV